MKKMISAARYFSSSRTWMAADSSTPRTSITEIFPRSGKPTSNQRQSGAVAGATNSDEPKSAPMTSLEGIFAEPAKTKRGGRCWRNNCFNGVSSLRTAFRIFEGNLPARRSRRSTIWSSDGDFTSGVVFQSYLSACDSSAVENTLSNANVPPYRDSRLLIFQPKLKIFRFFSMSLNIKILSEAANQARGLCMDAVQASKSGHLGLP